MQIRSKVGKPSKAEESNTPADKKERFGGWHSEKVCANLSHGVLSLLGLSETQSQIRRLKLFFVTFRSSH